MSRLRTVIAGVFTSTGADAAPTLATQGIAFTGIPVSINLIAKTSGVDIPIEFEYHWRSLSGEWQIDSGWGLSGTQALAAVTTPSPLQNLEGAGNGERFYARRLTAGAATTLTVTVEATYRED